MNELCSKGHFDWYTPPDGKRRCRTCKKINASKYYLQFENQIKALENERNRHLRMEVLLAYGGRCTCCGEWHYEFLDIDHVNGGGRTHIKTIGTGRAFYRWLKANDYPEEFRVLCSNCNQSYGRYGYCIHAEPTSGAIV